MGLLSKSLKQSIFKLNMYLEWTGETFTELYVRNRIKKAHKCEGLAKIQAQR